MIYLGANVPTEQFAEMAASVRADLVVLVAQTLVTAATLQEVAWRLDSQGVESAFGGRIFSVNPALVESIPAHFLGNSLRDALDEKVSSKPVSQEYAAARQFFTSKRAEIELTLRQHIQPLTVSHEGLMSGITHLGNNIAAALQLGELP